MRKETDYASRLQKAIFNAVMEESMSEDGKTATVLSGDVVDTLINMMAFFTHTSAEMATPSKVRKTCDDLARRLQRCVSAMQAHAAEKPIDFMRTIEVGTPQ